MLILPPMHGIISPKTAGGDVPTQSISYVAASTQWLSMTSADFGTFDRALWAVSVWIKRSSIGSTQTVFSKFTTLPIINLTLTSTNAILYRTRDGGVSISNTSNETLTDTASWHNLLFWYDSANGNGNLRKRAWLDGAELTWASSANPGAAVDSTADIPQWGGQQNDGTGAFDGLQYQGSFFSGTNPDISTIYSSGHPLSVTSLPGLWSTLDVAAGVVTHDGVLVPAWTNNNTATASSTIPT